MNPKFNIGDIVKHRLRGLFVIIDYHPKKNHVIFGTCKYTMSRLLSEEPDRYPLYNEDNFELATDEDIVLQLTELLDKHSISDDLSVAFLDDSSIIYDRVSGETICLSIKDTFKLKDLLNRRFV